MNVLPDINVNAASERAADAAMDRNYFRNMVTMTIFWSAASFSTFLLNFMNKYLEGSIFDNNYAEGFAGVLSVLIGS